MEVYLFIFLTVLVGHVQSEWCNTNDNSYISCQYDCCGSSGHHYCCNTYSDITIYPVYGVGAIVGIVIGSLAGLGILIGIIACCCCYQRRGATSGLVLQPHANPAFSVSSVTTTNGATMLMTQVPQMAGGYLPGNAAMNYPYGAPQSMK